MGPILGFDDDESMLLLQDIYNKVYKEPNPIPTKLYTRIHDSQELQPYMDSFLRIHNQVIQLCHDQVLYNKILNSI